MTNRIKYNQINNENLFSCSYRILNPEADRNVLSAIVIRYSSFVVSSNAILSKSNSNIMLALGYISAHLRVSYKLYIASLASHVSDNYMNLALELGNYFLI